jgi:hydroxymethylglutaryl-CoA reductase
MKKESTTGRLADLSPLARREQLAASFDLSDLEMLHTGDSTEGLELADALIENAVGYTSVPLGLIEGLLVDGQSVAVPVAVEEPSVVAAASFAARIMASAGGFRTWADDPIMTAQIHLESVKDDAMHRLEASRDEIQEFFGPTLSGMAARGGGFRAARWSENSQTGTLRVDVDIDVRDAMGANVLNTAAEAAGPLLSSITGGTVLMAILSNSARQRKAGAEFAIPLAKLARVRPGGVPAATWADRIVLANRIAETDPDRGVTHNKGIMNGITSLALATGNDTRGIEAAAHAWAARDGHYTSLTTYDVREDTLRGSIELPLPFASVGGAIGYHPAYSMALKLLGNPDGRRLSRIAAALGLAQNFAALLALVTTGIQKGHMRLHAQRIAYREGARGSEIAGVARAMAGKGAVNARSARVILEELRSKR